MIKFILSHDPEYEGECPCARFEYMGCLIVCHCWRSMCENCCAYSGLHIDGDCDIIKAREILQEIKQIWDNTEWTIVLNEVNYDNQ